MKIGLVGWWAMGLALVAPGLYAQAPTPATTDPQPKSLVPSPACEITSNSTEPGRTAERTNTSVVVFNSVEVNPSQCDTPYRGSDPGDRTKPRPD